MGQFGAKQPLEEIAAVRRKNKFVEMDEIRQMEQNIDKEDKEVMN